VTNRGIIAVALAAALAVPAGAGAQFTTFVQPPPRPAPLTATIDTVGGVIDTTTMVTADNMRAWVDSVAGDIVPRRDTTWRETTTRGFVDGSRAPDTATTLPVLLILGASAVGAGMILLRTRA
jgi:hypothetical protein